MFLNYTVSGQELNWMLKCSFNQGWFGQGRGLLFIYWASATAQGHCGAAAELKGPQANLASSVAVYILLTVFFLAYWRILLWTLVNKR